MAWYVYILRCSDASYYVGSTDDVDCRLSQHYEGAYDGYTARRRPLRLVYTEEYADKRDAFARERQLKGWSRAKKEALIAGNFRRLQVLSRNHRDVLAGRQTSAGSV